MANKVSEDFIENNIYGKNVLDFGCGEGDFTRKLSKKYTVTAIDVYDVADTSGFKFVKGNFLDLSFDGSFDTIVNASSLEHSGIDMNRTVDMDEDYAVAKKMMGLLSPNGRIIMTSPYGRKATYFVSKDGEYCDLSDCPLWGWRAYTEEIILEMFSGMAITKKEIWLYTYGGVNKRESYILESSANRDSFDNERRATICAVLEFA